MSESSASKGEQKRKAEEAPEGTKSPKRARGPSSPDRAPRSSVTERDALRSDSSGASRSESVFPQTELRAETSAVAFTTLAAPTTLVASSAPLHVSQSQEPASNLLAYSSWERGVFQEGARLFMNREYDGMVRVTNSRTGLFRAPYRMGGSGVYTSDLVGQFSTSSGYVTAQVTTTFKPWPRQAASAPLPVPGASSSPSLSTTPSSRPSSSTHSLTPKR
jgi:hypothetical protein